jgi:hypothetical protein
MLIAGAEKEKGAALAGGARYSWHSPTVTTQVAKLQIACCVVRTKMDDAWSTFSEA